MPTKKGQTQKGQPLEDKNERTLKNQEDRPKKIMNSVANITIILTSIMMSALTNIMTNTTGAMASGMAEAIGGKEAGEKVDKEIKQKLPEIDEKMKTLISDMRKEMYAQNQQKSKETDTLLSDSVFDIGPEIIGKYDFKLPKLTEELDDNTLAQYTQLLLSEDPNFAEMFKKLTGWLNTLPKAPEKADKETTSP